jgi:GH24 family phage-related lysozyme (muramidase)
MTITTHASEGDYLDDTNLMQILRRFEGFESLAYDDDKGYITIGIGINLSNRPVNGRTQDNDANLALVLEELGIFEAAAAQNPNQTVAQRKELFRTVLQQFRTIIDSYIPGTTTEAALRTLLATATAEYGVAAFQLGTDQPVDEARAREVKRLFVLGRTIQPFNIMSLADANSPDADVWIQAGAEHRLDARLSGLGIGHDTKEYMALMSLFFNAETLIGPSLRRALGSMGSTADRAEAWFQIRYASNKDRSGGVARRRAVEAQLFGLYDAQELEDVPTATDARRAYRMLTLHRESIQTYEAVIGANGTPLSAYIAAADAELDLDDVAGHTPTLLEAFEPAQRGIVADILVKHGVQLNRTDADALNVFIDVGAPTGAIDVDGWDNTIDSIVRNGAVEEIRNDIVIGEGGDDTLISGSGDDVLEGGKDRDTLRGGAGNDLYLYRSGDGIDTIQDEDGGRIYFDGVLISSSGATPMTSGGSPLGPTWRTEILGHTFYFTQTANNALWISTSVPASTNTDRIVIEDFHSGDFGITLPIFLSSSATTLSENGAVQLSALLAGGARAGDFARLTSNNSAVSAAVTGAETLIFRGYPTY